MEEKKFDPYQFIGFILIALILTWMLYRNGPEQETAKSDTKIKTEQVEGNQIDQVLKDSIQQQQKVLAYGDLGRLFEPNSVPSTKFSTDKMILEFEAKGGGISRLALSEFQNHEDQPVPMVQDGNMNFNISLNTKDGRVLNTRDFYFTPTLTEKSDLFTLEMKAMLSDSQYISYQYNFPKKGYLFTVTFKTVGMEAIIDNYQNPKVNWSTDVYRNSRSIDYENRYTEYTFGYEDDRVDYLSLSGEDRETRQDIRWISYRQHFFSSILIPDSNITLSG